MELYLAIAKTSTRAGTRTERHLGTEETLEAFRLRIRGEARPGDTVDIKVRAL